MSIFITFHCHAMIFRDMQTGLQRFFLSHSRIFHGHNGQLFVLQMIPKEHEISALRFSGIPIWQFLKILFDIKRKNAITIL